MDAPEHDPPPFRPIAARRGGSRLPLFRLDAGPAVLYYAPGLVCAVDAADGDGFEAALAAGGAGSPWAERLHRQAQAAVEQRRQAAEAPYLPECLTLYPDNACNLECVYCFSAAARGTAARVSLAAIAAAARAVARNCRDKGRPLVVAFHGGGEPVLDRDRVERALRVVREAARAHGVDLFRYVATNGVLSEAKARWLAGAFDLVGLSCDGPPDLHDRQRPRRGGSGSAAAVVRTARILREEGVPLHARATITAGSLGRQVEIVRYLCQELAPREIHLEPVYRGGRAGEGAALAAGQAEPYARQFLAARAAAREHGVTLVAPGSRPGAIHGRHCQVLRQVLNLVPGDVASPCFKLCDGDEVRARGLAVGAFERATGEFPVSLELVESLRSRLGTEPAECAGCFNRFHCAGECPDVCPLDGEAGAAAEGARGFRCRAQRAIAFGSVLEAAGRLRPGPEAGGVAPPRGVPVG